MSSSQSYPTVQIAVSHNTGWRKVRPDLCQMDAGGTNTNASKHHCGKFYLEDFPVLPEAEIEQLDKEAATRARGLKKKGFAKTKQEVTFCKLCGPIHPKYAKARPAYWDRGRRQNAEQIDVHEVLDA